MNNAINQLLNALPDGPKKRALMEKMQAKKEASNAGLNDTFEFKAHGHIRIEEIDAAGSVVGILADQPNLVVKGAEEILLRAFSGDPERVLYKNRIPKALSGTSPKYHVALSDNVSRVLNGVNQLSFAPNMYWNAVNEEDFDVTYSYRPITVFLKEEVSDAVGKKAFSISKASSVNLIPLSSEIYSSSTNLFIGLGDGVNAPLALNDSRLVYTAGWAVAAGKRTATVVNETITITEKMSNLVVEFEKSNKGGQIEVSIDGVAQPAIETLDSGLVAPAASSKAYAGLVGTAEHTIIIKYSGFDPSLTSAEANVVITGIRTDGLTTGMNGLMHEFDAFTKSFATTTAYNTTNIAPFFVQLQNLPVVKESVVVEYNAVKLGQVATKAEVVEGKYFVDDVTGQLFFNRTLSGLLVTYGITGESYNVKAASALIAATLNVPVVAEAVTADGTKTIFDLAHKDLVGGSVIVKVGGTVTAVTVDNVNGKITFAVAPAAVAVITVDYSYKVTGKSFDAGVAIRGVKVLNRETGSAYTSVAAAKDLAKGTYLVDPADNKKLVIHANDATDAPVINFVIIVDSADLNGFATGYTRQVIDKPKNGLTYPWYQLDKGSVMFIAEFAEKTPNYNVTIREMGLFDGPRNSDKVEGFSGYPVDTFSLVRVGETRKETTTGIRVTWTITLVNQSGDPFYAGF